MGKGEEFASMDDLTKDTLELACRYTALTQPDAGFHYRDRGIMDFIPTDKGWICRAFPAVQEAATPIMVPREGVRKTMLEAVVALNQWLTVAVCQVNRRGSA